MRRVVVLVVAVAIVVPAGSAGSGPTPQVVRLPLDEALAIADDGRVVGSLLGGGCGGRPVLWRAGRLTVLTPPGDCGAAQGINNNGAVVGWHLPADGDGFTAFVWRGHVAGPGPVPKSAVISEASGIDDRGRTVGTTDVWWDENVDEDPITWPEPRARLWSGGKSVDLGTLGGGASVARAVNDRGQVVGLSKTAAGVWHAFLWERGKMTDLGGLGGRTSGANGINERGQIVGYSGTGKGETHAVLWQNGRAGDLGTLAGGRNSRADAINERGEIVGSGETATGMGHAILWQNGAVRDLGTLSGDVWSTAADVNERGQIVGSSGRDRSSLPHAVLWTLRHR